MARETKDIIVPLRHRQRALERRATFGHRVSAVIMDAVDSERAAGWELDELIDFESLQRAGRIQWETSFTLNPLGDMNRAVSVTVRLTRMVPVLERKR